MGLFRETRCKRVESSEPEMKNLAIGLIVVWGAGLLFLVGRAANFIRLVYNNVAPGKSHWDPGYILRKSLFRPYFLTDARAINPANLNDAGRQYRKEAIRNDWITLGWASGGFALIIWASPYFMAE